MWTRTISFTVLTIVVCDAASSNSYQFDLNPIPEVELFPILPIVIPNSHNDQCKRDSLLFLDSIKNSTTWAYQMWDASAKRLNSVLTGNGYHLGDFVECLQIQEPFPTQYCLVGVTIHAAPTRELDKYTVEKDPFDLVTNALYYKGDPSQGHRDRTNYGLCVPKSCTREELTTALNTYLENKTAEGTLNVSYSVNIPPLLCQSAAENRWEIGAIVFSFIVAILLILAAISTCIDGRQQLKSIVPDSITMNQRIVRAFSLRNTYALLVEDANDNPRTLSLHGIRFCSIFFIPFGHLLGVFYIGPVMNRSLTENILRSFGGSFLTHADLLVDTFFVLSGLLTSYVYMKQSQTRFVNPLLMIIWRYLRITPLYAIILLYFTFVMQKTGEGPLWRLIMDSEQAICKQTWWTNLLFVNNLVQTDRMCMIHTWYLPCDMQLFIVAVVLLNILRKNTKAGLISIMGVIVLSIALNFSIVYFNKADGVLHFYESFVQEPRQDRMFNMIYTKTYTRGASYFIGVLFGYLLFKWSKSTSRELNMVLSVTYAFVAIVIMFLPIAAGHIFYIPDFPYNVFVAAAYSAIHRPVWAFGLSLLIYAIGFGNVPLASQFLTCKAFVPLSKLTFGTYLIHLCFVLRYIGEQKSAEEKLLFNMIMDVSGILVWCYVFSFFGFIFVEAPVKLFINDILRPPTKVHNKSSQKPSVEPFSEITITNDTFM